MTNNIEVLHHWGNIYKCQRKIEDLRIQIGRLKDEIMMEEQEIVKLQKDDQERNAPVFDPRVGPMQHTIGEYRESAPRVN